MLLLLLVFLASNQIYSRMPVFTSGEYTVTSFTDVEFKNKYPRYFVKSNNYKIYFDFPVSLAPLSKIRVYGVNFLDRCLYVNHSNNLIILSESRLMKRISEFRINLTHNILENYPKSFALILSLVLGNKTFLKSQFLEFVRMSGLAHAFALSGMHLAIFLALFIFLADFLKIPKRIYCIFLFIPALAYLFLGGMGVSLIRAFLFFCFWSFSVLIRVPISLKRIWSITLLGSILFAPHNIYSLSFILSYSALFGIIYFYPLLYSPFKIFGNFLGNLAAISFSASIAVAPVLIWNFGEYNFLGPIASMIVVPFMPILISLCFTAVILSMFNISIAGIDSIIDIFYNFIFIISEKFSIMFRSVVFFDHPKLYSVLISVIIVLIFICRLRKSIYE
ncbi:MAG: ComEC/Rec2 family competence protein [Brevinemataceae bacterium]